MFHDAIHQRVGRYTIGLYDKRANVDTYFFLFLIFFYFIFCRCKYPLTAMAMHVSKMSSDWLTCSSAPCNLYAPAPNRVVSSRASTNSPAAAALLYTSHLYTSNISDHLLPDIWHACFSPSQYIILPAPYLRDIGAYVVYSL